MITIFKNKKDIPESMEYIELNDLFFNKNTVMKIDEKAKEIINKIDGAQLIGKYNDFTLDIDKLSTGCKTVLNVLYFSNKVFCLKECGNNALEILYKLEKGYVYSEYPLIPFDVGSVVVQTREIKTVINDYEKLKEWWE